MSGPTMRALVKTTAAPGVELLDVARPTPLPNEVLIEVHTAAICGTDLHIFRWDDWAKGAVTPPVTIGHEFVGTIVEVGDLVTHLDVGTRVAGEGHITCGRCRNCRAGDGHLCRDTISIGIQRNGGFAEFVSLPASNVYPIPDSVSDDIGAILDPLGNAVHTVLSFDLVGEDVLITGAGPIGQMACAIARHIGARHIVITDVEPNRLDIAAAMGATRTVDVNSESLRDVMQQLGMTEGFDVGFEMSGNPRAVQDIFGAINHGGKVALLGLFSEPANVDLNQAIFKGLTIKGIYGREIFGTWYKAVSMLESGLDVSPVISHRVPLEEFATAFELLTTGQGSKILLTIK